MTETSNLSVIPEMIIDPHGNHNNHDAILFYRDMWRANAQLFALENQTLAKIRAIAHSINEDIRRF